MEISLRRNEEPWGKRILKWGIFAILLFLEAGYFLITPPFQAPDEPAHFFRIWQLSEGRLRGYRQGEQAGDEVPKVILSQTYFFGELPFHPENKITPDFFLKTLSSSPKLDERLLNERGFAQFSN